MDGTITAASLADAAPLQLGDLGLRPPLRQVAGPAGAITVEPRVMQLLLALARQAGEVVSRDALLALCWPGVVVGDDSLHRAVVGARRALKASGTTAAIETMPRIGYRLVVASASDPAAPASETHPAAPASEPYPAASATDNPALPPASGISRRVLAGLAVSGVGLYAGWRLWPRQAPRPPMVDRLIAQAEQAMRLAEPDAERQGVGFLREAVRLAPADAEVWGRLALALRTVAEYAPAPRTSRALVDAEQAARIALRLQPGQADARAVLALLAPMHGNWWTIEQQLQAILADVPDHLPSLDALSMVQAGAGLVRGHYPLRLRTVALDPLHAGYNFRAIYAHWMNGNLPAADRAATRGVELWPRHFATWTARTMLFAFGGRPERALALLASTNPAPPLPPPLVGIMTAVVRALLTGKAADRVAARIRIEAAVARGGPFMAVTGSMSLAALGAAEPALAVSEAFLLERGPIMAGSAWQPGQLLHNDIRRRFTNHLFTPVMAPLWPMPGFATLVRDIGLVDYWRSSGHRPDYLAGRPLP